MLCVVVLVVGVGEWFLYELDECCLCVFFSPKRKFEFSFV